MNDQQPLPSDGTSPKTGLAVTSLLLGILSIVPCSILAGAPAIITGHIARGRALKEPHLYGGAGKALAGLVMGYISLALTVLIVPVAISAGLLLPALAKAKGRAQTISCTSNMKQIGLAARLWANDHNDVFPPDLITMSNELFSPKILVCPGDSSKTQATDWANFNPAQNVSYEFLTPNAKEADVMNQAAFRCPIHGNIGMGDGSVQEGSGMRRR